MRPLTWLVLLLAVLPRAEALVIVAPGQPPAVIVPGDRNPARLATAKLLQGLVKQSTGQELPVADDPAGRTAIRLGPTPSVSLAGLDEDGFVLRGLDARTYVVAGPTEWGTEFGVCEFLERYVGVRWLLPGADGCDVPQRERLEVPPDEVRQQPVFFSRLLSGLRGPAQGEWARRNRMHGRVSFHHNLLNLFPASRYTKTHPEFFPVYGGQRYLPTKDDDHTWQPNFAAPGIAAEGARNIKEFFRTHPDVTSYSLGINDTHRFDESPESLARETGRKNFLGQRDVSDSYYSWCNEVVTEVLKEYPDKWFGLLAYNNVVEPPTRVKLHPRLIPYMTYDRHKWIHDEVRAHGEELTRRWQAMSPTLGWYDYTYGSPYLLPRVYPHQMARYLKFGRDHGVRAHYAEIYPNWGEGPKPYVFLKLQWNPDADVDALLDDWYRRCVGPEAAPLLAEYYAIWERFWTVDVLRSKWFTVSGQYLNFAAPGYLADAKESDVRRSRELLDQCLAKAQTPPQKARAALLRDAFAYYEASAIAYQADAAARGRTIRTETDAAALLERAEERTAMGQRRLQLLEQWRDHPVLAHPLSASQYGGVSGTNWGTGSIWQVYDWIARSATVRARVEALAARREGSLAEQARTVLQVVDGRAKRLNPNPSFEDGVAPWGLWVASTGAVKLTTAAAHTGKSAVLCDGLARGGPHQTVPIRPGRYVSVASFLIPEGQQSTGTVAVAATMRGDDDKNLPSPLTEVTPTPGTWVTIACPLTVPEKVNQVKVTRALLVAIINGFKPGEKVYVDDLALYQAAD